MLSSNNHLRAEADYRRELLRRRVPLDAPEVFHLEASERRVGSDPATRSPLMSKARHALGRMAQVDVARVTRLLKRRPA